jgi:hypothetical protein
MIALDLCCGRGGWARGLMQEGWEVIGVDLADFSKWYPGKFVQANLLTWEGWRTSGAKLIVASPPCEEFSRWGMPWTRARNPPQPSLALVERCRDIAEQLDVPFILENVRDAQKWLGRSKLNVGPFHLWGDVPALMPQCRIRPKQSRSSTARAERAMVPIEMASFIGRCFKNFS